MATYYSEKFQTLWHDAAPDGIVRPSQLQMYMLETSNRQCRASGLDLDRLFYEEGRGFLLARMQTRIDRPLHAYESIEVRTWCPPSRGVTFLRCFRVLRGDEVIAEAASSWAMLDARTHTFVKVSDLASYECPVDDMIPSATLPKLVRLSPHLEMEPVGERRVRRSETDFNGHMNNTKYPDMVCDFLPDCPDRRVRTLSLSFVKEAPRDDVLRMYRTAGAAGDGDWLVKGVRSDGQICFEAEVTLCGKDE